MDAKKIRLLVIVSGLQAAGAELMLFRMLKNIDRSRFEMHVISLREIDKVGALMQEEGISVDSLKMNSFFQMILRLPLLIWQIRSYKPDIVQTWMYHANLLGGLAARILNIRRVVWSVRSSALSSKNTKSSTLAVIKGGAMTSSWLPQKIVSCSKIAQTDHIATGYPANKFVLIPNGFNLNDLKPNALTRKAMRDKLNLSDDVPLIGLAGRYDPQKNHIGFIKAALLVTRRIPNVQFIMVGKNVDTKNEELMKEIRSTELINRFHLQGECSDISSFMTSLDLLVSASNFGEAFPNVLAEAMACGVPCVATDVGDSAFIVGDSGRIVPPSDLQALSNAIIELLSLTKEQLQRLSEAGQKRVQSLFNITSVVAQYENLYISLAKD